jgi:hypothetical protein
MKDIISLQFNQNTVGFAVAEILLILVVASLAGWAIAKVIIILQARRLEETIEVRKVEIETYRNGIQAVLHGVIPMQGHASKTVFPASNATDAAPQDLKIIEGVGPRIEEMLNREGIFTYLSLSETSPIRLSSILRNAGPRFQIQDPSSWPKQAALAQMGKWEDLYKLKRQLVSGNSDQQ